MESDEEIEEEAGFASRENKEIVIPGFGSKQRLERKLQSEKVAEPDQTGNVIKVPLEYGELTQEDIIGLLRAKKKA